MELFESEVQDIWKEVKAFRNNHNLIEDGVLAYQVRSDFPWLLFGRESFLMGSSLGFGQVHGPF
jgi:hypothetical protein